MKIVVLFISLMVFSNLFGQTKIEKNLTKAFVDAKLQNKQVLILAYIPSIPSGQKYDSLYQLNSLSNYLNQFFINYKLNLSDSSQAQILNKYKVQLSTYPTLLYFDADENLVHFDEPKPDVDKVISACQIFRFGISSCLELRKKFMADKQSLSIDDYVKLGQFARMKRDTTTSLLFIGDLIYDQYNKDSMSSKLSYTITKKAVFNLQNGFARYWINHLDLAAKYEAEDNMPGLEKQVMSIIVQQTLFSPNYKKYKMEDVSLIKDAMTALGLERYIDENIWQVQAVALVNEGGFEQAVDYIESLVKANQDKPNFLIYYLKFINDNFDYEIMNIKQKNIMYFVLPKISNNSSLLAEYYFEVARLAIREKTKLLAQKQAKRALFEAQLSKFPELQRFYDLIAQTNKMAN